MSDQVRLDVREHYGLLTRWRDEMLALPGLLDAARAEVRQTEELVRQAKSDLANAESYVWEDVLGNPELSNDAKRKSALATGLAKSPLYQQALESTHKAQSELSRAQDVLEKHRDRRRALEAAQAGSIQILQTVTTLFVPNQTKGEIR